MMKQVAVALGALCLSWMAGTSGASAAGCTSATYQLSGIAGQTYTLSACDRQVTVDANGGAFFNGMENDEGPMLEGSVRYANRCGSFDLPAQSEDIPDWGSGASSIILHAQLPTFDGNCNRIGESDTTWRLERVSRQMMGTAAAMPPGMGQSVFLHADAIPVGKWPEGLAFDGFGLWVALSGDRQIARIDPNTLRITKTVKVGRLPVGMMATGDGRILALVNTDKLIWQQSVSGGRSGKLASIGDCPEAIAGDDQSIWVLADSGCSSAGSHLFRYDARSGKRLGDYLLDPNPFDVSVSAGTAYTIFAFQDHSVMQQVSARGEMSGFPFIGVRLFKINASRWGVFGAGDLGGNGVVASLAGGNDQTTLDQPIRAMTVTSEGSIVAVGTSGRSTSWRRRIFRCARRSPPTSGFFEPRAVIAVGDRLYISTQTGLGDNGSVLVVDNWQ